MPKEKKVIEFGGRRYEVIGRNRLTARIFEAVAARSGSIMQALDEARGSDARKPSYHHTIYLGSDDDGRLLRATVSVFPNSVSIQTLREVK